MSGTISFTGLFSGLDTAEIVEELLEIERQPLYVIEESQETLEEELSVYEDLESRLTSLETAIDALNTLTTVNAKAATSSNENAIGASASYAASNGTYTINSITQLATNASEATIGVTSKEAEFVSGSTFSFDVGDETVEIILEAGQNTLEDLRDAINDEASDLVTASIIDTGDPDDPYKLVITSNGTGEENDISNLSTDIVVSTSGGDAALSFVSEESVDAQDAIFKLGGVTIQRSSNTISDLIDGVTLELKTETASPTTITVESDSEELQAAVEGFIEAYNEVNSLIQAQFEFDEEVGSAGVLSGDATLRQVQSNLQSLVATGIEDADGNRYSLASIGVEIDRYSGDLSLDTEAFQDAVENGDTDFLRNLLLANGTTTSNDVSYITSSDDTRAGTYGIVVTGYDGDGNVQGYFTYDGETYEAEGSGQYLIGAADSPMEDLRVKIDNGVTGDLGEIYYSVGVAEQFERTLDDYLTPIAGLLPSIETQIEEQIAEIDDQIADFEERLAIREAELYAQFVEVEEALAELQTMQDTIDQQLAALSSS